MPITYGDIKHKLQPPLDCSEIEDFRGRHFHNRLILNFDNTDFSGCVLFHCFPSGMRNALEVNPAQSEDNVTLIGSNLEGADLYKADLYRANLQGANLRDADLTVANLKNANLEGANLQYANLEEVDLSGANLSGADLTGATLYLAILRFANLTGANLQNTNLREAIFREANLEGAICSENTGIYATFEQLDSMIFVEDED